MRSYGSINAVPEVQRRPSNRNSIMFAVRAGLVTAVAAAVITLAAIAKFLNDKTVREELGKADDAAAILNVFENRSPRP